jgi:glycosyltransferase involved in cell wall biosynthesis
MVIMILIELRSPLDRKWGTVGIRFGFVSTYPPTFCGIATFTRSLMSAIQDLDSHSASIVRLLDSPTEEVSIFKTPEVISYLRAGDPDSLNEAIRHLNEMDVAIIQHEFGIYGGDDGDEAVTLVKGLQVPSIVVLHTVVNEPTENQRQVLITLCRQASAVVTMSVAARDRLVAKYSVDTTKVSVVPHGAPPIPVAAPKGKAEPAQILTWGLLGPGKGIEWAIDAMSLLRDITPTPHYIVAGRTHPKVLSREGESYREDLQRRIDKLKLSDTVRLQPEYLNNADLANLVASSTVVLLPYDSTDQVTSGVLIEAVTAARPVVATGFPHAVELLSSGGGTIVPHHNPEAMAQALREILEQPSIAAEMSRQSGAIAKELLWSSVAVRYVELAVTLIRAEAAA